MQVVLVSGLLMGLPVPLCRTVPVAVVPAYIDQLNTVPVCGEVKEMFAFPPEQGVELPTVDVTLGVATIVTLAVVVTEGHASTAAMV